METCGFCTLNGDYGGTWGCQASKRHDLSPTSSAFLYAPISHSNPFTPHHCLQTHLTNPSKPSTFTERKPPLAFLLLALTRAFTRIALTDLLLVRTKQRRLASPPGKHQPPWLCQPYPPRGRTWTSSSFASSWPKKAALNPLSIFIYPISLIC